MVGGHRLVHRLGQGIKYPVGVQVPQEFGLGEDGKGGRKPDKPGRIHVDGEALFVVKIDGKGGEHLAAHPAVDIQGHPSRNAVEGPFRCRRRQHPFAHVPNGGTKGGNLHRVEGRHQRGTPRLLLGAHISHIDGIHSGKLVHHRVKAHI